MFDVAPTELLLVIVVALVVIGPKDLPTAMRFVEDAAAAAASPEHDETHAVPPRDGPLP